MSHEEACRRAFARYMELRTRVPSVDADGSGWISSNAKADANKLKLGNNRPISNELTNESAEDVPDDR